MGTPALLTLADGTRFYGTSIGANGEVVGEVLFNTSMTGYQEILSDPSYAKQIVTFTYPHIGNVGCNREDQESDQVFASGVVIRDQTIETSNWRSEQTLSEYLRENNVVGIAEIDTRRLTRILREKGAQNASIVTGESIDEAKALELAQGFAGLKGADLAKEVTCKSTYSWSESTWKLGEGHSTPEADASRFKVVAYDFGVKHNILRLLVEHGCDVTVVPATTPAADVLAMQPDGVFLSNGPGDPQPCDYAIAAIQEILAEKLPIFGICLGHQLLALASGAKTEKMKFGHHGANHPVQCLESGKVFITSQNHGFAVDESYMPDNLVATHRSLFDGTLQGIARTDCPAFSFQGHPEASPGPQDVVGLFAQFTEMMARNK